MSHSTTSVPPTRRSLTRRSLTRRSLLACGLGAGTTLLLTACGEGSSGSGEPSASAGRTSADGIPLDPQRVVAMYATDADYALTLGLPLVAAHSTATTGFPAYQASLLQGVTPVLTYPDPNYELIAASRPDLIFQSSLSYTPEHEEPLSKIAPIYSFPASMIDGATPWQDSLREAARTFERTDVWAWPSRRPSRPRSPSGGPTSPTRRWSCWATPTSSCCGRTRATARWR